MATWIVGDVHGCSAELSRLLDCLRWTSDDVLVSVGDLFHRGPDPLGVLRQLERIGARFVLGNHELAVLRRAGLAPRSTAPDDRPALRTEFPALDADDLAGDGGTPCDVEPAARADVLRFLQRHSGYFVREREDTATPSHWCVVHAGRVPGVALERNSIRDLTALRRLDAPGRPWWYERYGGPELVLFGHTPSQLPRIQRVAGRTLAIGLDTGCVYGGRLTAYCPERDEFRSVCAARAYAAV
jgi:hypothetical protein